MSDCKIRPLRDRVIVQRMAAKDVSDGGIVLPNSAVEGEVSNLAKVIEVGDTTELTAGDTVVLGKYSGTEIEIDDEKFIIISVEDALAVVKS